jgi:hypothetical protein
MAQESELGEVHLDGERERGGIVRRELSGRIRGLAVTIIEDARIGDEPATIAASDSRKSASPRQWNRTDRPAPHRGWRSSLSGHVFRISSTSRGMRTVFPWVQRAIWSFQFGWSGQPFSPVETMAWTELESPRSA